jgi:putative exosortase-associated protein (TIGR04073 family)
MRLLPVFMVVGLLATGFLRAETVAGTDLSDAEVIVQDMSAKLCRGAANVLTGWGEIPRQMIVAGRERGAWAVLPVGIPAGLIMTVARTGVGAVETVLFFVPYNNSYGPMLHPAFVWQKRHSDGESAETPEQP